MESGRKGGQVTLLALALTLCSCRPAPAPQAPPPAPDTSLLQAGDLLYRYGNGFYSAYFRDFSLREKRYSHVGVLARAGVGGALCVVHSEASELTGQGGVRSDSLAVFLEGASGWAVCRLKADEKTRLAVADRALDYCRQRLPFDLDFDATDSSAFYCTELVMHCVNTAAGQRLIQPSTPLRGKMFVAIDDTYLHDWIETVLKNTDRR